MHFSARYEHLTLLEVQEWGVCYYKRLKIVSRLNNVSFRACRPLSSELIFKFCRTHSPANGVAENELSILGLSVVTKVDCNKEYEDR